MTCLLISGPIATGKTAAAVALAEMHNAQLIKVRQALLDILGEPVLVHDRQELQRQGALLDRRTNGRWLLEYVAEHREGHPILVVDALRTRRQTLPVLEAIPGSQLIYLEAHEETRRFRYALAGQTDPVKASVPFDVAMRHPTETEVFRMRAVAHMVIETDELSPSQVASSIGL